VDGLESKIQNKNKIPREFDESCGCKTKRVRMERLQWGFPIATALSLNRPKRNDPSNAVDGLEGRKRIKKKTSHGMTRKNTESNQ
jgi:hypothetical protein